MRCANRGVPHTAKRVTPVLIGEDQNNVGFIYHGPANERYCVSLPLLDGQSLLSIIELSLSGSVSRAIGTSAKPLCDDIDS